MHNHLRDELSATVSGRDLVRLQCLFHQSSDAWLQVIPSGALGLEISRVLRVLVRFWFGLPILEETCAFCGSSCDLYGDHALCCEQAEFYSRHQAVVELLTSFIQSAGVSVENDVGVAGSSPRPGDLLMTRWPGGVPRMADVVVTHLLAPSLGLSLASALAAVVKEARKTSKYAEVISPHNLDFTPLALSTFGHLGQPGSDLLSQAVGLNSAKHHLARSVVQAQFNERLSVVVIKSVGQRLLAASWGAAVPMEYVQMSKLCTNSVHHLGY